MRAARGTVAVAPLPEPSAVTRTAPVALVSLPRERPLAYPAAPARLLHRLDAATSRPSIESMAALRAALTDVVDRLKARGLSIEQVMAVFEALVREHAATRRQPLHVGTPTPHGAAGVHGRLLRWCAQAYRDDAWW